MIKVVEEKKSFAVLRFAFILKANKKVGNVPNLATAYQTEFTLSLSSLVQYIVTQQTSLGIETLGQPFVHRCVNNALEIKVCTEN